MTPPRRPSIPAIIPTDPFAGLSSKVNEDFILQVFSRSNIAQVERLIRMTRFRGAAQDPPPPTTGNRDELVERNVAAYLKTPEGVRHRTKVLEAIVAQQATAWFNSPQGQQELRRVKGELLADSVSRDGDLHTKACTEALAREVEKFLRSPLGIAQVEERKKRAVTDQAKAPASDGTSWVKRQVEGLRDAKRPPGP